MKFKSAEEMLKLIQSGVDLYSEKAEKYVFCYNEAGSLCCYTIDTDEAKELASQAVEHDEYWGAFLGVGGYIWDDPSYDGFDPDNHSSNLDLCEDLVEFDDWVDTRQYAGGIARDD